MPARSWKSTASKKKRAPSDAGVNEDDGERTFDAAKQAAYRVLSYRDHTAHEISAKLTAKGFSEELASRVISFLQEIGALDDLRFARQWARSRTEYRHFGPIRLRQELLEKGVSAAETDAVVEQLLEERDPVEAAEAALIRKFRDPAALEDLKSRHRAFAFLQRKGFATETILKVLRKIGTP